MLRDGPYVGSAFRRRAGEREALPTCGEGAAHYRSSSGVGIGAITSRHRDTWTFWQLLAFELSGGGDPEKALVPFCTVEQAKRMHAEGLIP